MKKLYFNKYTRATRVRWLIEEAGLDVEIVNVDLAKGEHKSPAYLKVHPLGKVPALQDGERTIIESGAITVHLADGTPFAPAVGTPARGPYYQWCFYAVASLEAPVAAYFYENRKPEGDRNATFLENTRREFMNVAAPLTEALAGKTWLVDDTFSAADILVGSVVAWAKSAGLLDGQADLLAYAERCAARPAFARART
jgi:glutathione S-transferase